MMLFARAVLAFLILPGIVAFALPLSFVLGRSVRPPFHIEGAVPLTLGIAFLLWTVRDFYVAGKGTLAPWDPPKRLVIVGLYRWTRNPMYVAVTLILVGWAVGFRSVAIAEYTAVVMVLFHVRVVFFEEPFLARTHGGDWEGYKARVPRWLIPIR